MIPPTVLAMLGAGVTGGMIARGIVHARGSGGWRAFWRDLPLVPLRDGLLALQWLAALFGSHVVWRGVRVAVDNPEAGRAGARVATSGQRPAVEVSDGR